MGRTITTTVSLQIELFNKILIFQELEKINFSAACQLLLQYGMIYKKILEYEKHGDIGNKTKFGVIRSKLEEEDYGGKGTFE